MSNRTPESGDVNTGSIVIAFPLHRVRRQAKEDDRPSSVDPVLTEWAMKFAEAWVRKQAGGVQCAL